MDPSELGSFLTGIRYHILTLIGNKEGLVVRHLQSPLINYFYGTCFCGKVIKGSGMFDFAKSDVQSVMR